MSISFHLYLLKKKVKNKVRKETGEESSVKMSKMRLKSDIYRFSDRQIAAKTSHTGFGFNG